MNILFSMLAVLAIGTVILMVGIFINKAPEQSFSSALHDSLIWGAGFFVAFGAKFMLLTSAYN